MTMLPKIVVKKGHMITKATITKIIKEARKKYLEWPFISIFSITELIRVILFINIVKGLIALTSELRKMTKKIFINAKNTKRQMDVAILYSGGKDSTLAIEYAIEKGWNIKYLLSVKPNRTDCYLFHFATVEQTKKLSEILGIKQIYTTCTEADPEKEATIIRKIVEANPVDSVILGGIGLQETQIKSIRNALFSLGVDVFASHTGKDHTKIMKEMIKRGYEIILTEVAADGLGDKWLGERLTADNIDAFVKTAEKFGFHPGGEGGPYNTLVVDGPIFSKRLEIMSFDKVMEGSFNGFIEVKEARVIDKFISIKN